MRLAVEKGEVEGICGLAWQTYKAISFDWIENHKINVIVQLGLGKNPELPDVPLAIDLLKNPDDRKVLELIVLPQEFGRPFLAPPGVPADRMAVYRKAFQAVLKDEQFRAEFGQAAPEHRAFGRPADPGSAGSGLCGPQAHPRPCGGLFRGAELSRPGAGHFTHKILIRLGYS